MTRKDYERIARAIASEYTRRKSIEQRLVIVAVASAIANELVLDNPRFDYDRFLDACGFETGA